MCPTTPASPNEAVSTTTNGSSWWAGTIVDCAWHPATATAKTATQPATPRRTEFRIQRIRPRPPGDSPVIDPVIWSPGQTGVHCGTSRVGDVDPGLLPRLLELRGPLHSDPGRLGVCHGHGHYA